MGTGSCQWKTPRLEVVVRSLTFASLEVGRFAASRPFKNSLVPTKWAPHMAQEPILGKMDDLVWAMVRFEIGLVNATTGCNAYFASPTSNVFELVPMFHLHPWSHLQTQLDV